MDVGGRRQGAFSSAIAQIHLAAEHARSVSSNGGGNFRILTYSGRPNLGFTRWNLWYLTG